MKSKNTVLIGSLAIVGVISYAAITYIGSSSDDGFSSAGNGKASGSIYRNQANSSGQQSGNNAANIEQDLPPGGPISNASNIDENVFKPASGDFRQAPEKYQHLESPEVDRAFIHINRDSITALEEGSYFKVGIPQSGEVYNVSTDTVEYHANGDKSVTGTIQHHDGEFYSVTFTQGKNATYGTMSTPEGVYILEADSTDGWLASKSDLMKKIDQSEPDFLEVPIEDEPLPF